jgi:hypothetical protein
VVIGGEGAQPGEVVVVVGGTEVTVITGVVVVIGVRQVGWWGVMVVGGKGARGQVVVVVRRERAGGGCCRVVVVRRSPSLLWVREWRWWVMERGGRCCCRGRGIRHEVVVGGEGGIPTSPHSYTKEKKCGSIHKMPQNDKARLFGCNKEIGAVTSGYPWISVTSHPYLYISVSLRNPWMFIQI